MIRKTEGIVLRTLKHQDAHLITTIYTREFGLQSFIVKGFRSPRARKRHSFFQPLSVVELVLYFHEQRKLHTVSESRNVIPYQAIQTEPIKLCLGLVALETFLSAVKEEEQNEALYDFLRAFVIELEMQNDQLVHLLIFFLVHLTSHLGFFPQDESEEGKPCRFDPKAGLLARSDFPEEASEALRQFLHTDLNGCRRIIFSREAKRRLIQRLLEYYQHHSEAFRWPQSLSVFEEMFV